MEEESGHCYPLSSVLFVPNPGIIVHVHGWGSHSSFLSSVDGGFYLQRTKNMHILFRPLCQFKVDPSVTEGPHASLMSCPWTPFISFCPLLITCWTAQCLMGNNRRVYGVTSLNQWVQNVRQPWIVLLLVLIGGISTLGMDLPCVEMCCSSVWTLFEVCSPWFRMSAQWDSHPLFHLFRCRPQQTLFVCRSHPPLS